MIFVYLIVLITDIFLIFYGNLTVWLGFPIFLFCIIRIFSYLFKILKTNYRSQQLKREIKAKWIGKLSLIEGFDLVPNQDLYVALTRRDSLLFISEQSDFNISLEDLEGLLVTKGENLLSVSDDYLKKLLNRNSEAKVFDYLRSLIKKNQYYAKRTVIIISLRNRDEKSNNIRWIRDIAIMMISHGKSNFFQLLKRPEIRSKVRFLDHGSKKQNKEFADRAKGVL